MLLVPRDLKPGELGYAIYRTSLPRLARSAIRSARAGCTRYRRATKRPPIVVGLGRTTTTRQSNGGRSGTDCFWETRLVLLSMLISFGPCPLAGGAGLLVREAPARATIEEFWGLVS